MAVEFRLAIENRLGINMPMLSLTAGVTLSSIAMRMVKAASAGSDDSDMATRVLPHKTDDEFGRRTGRRARSPYAVKLG